MIEHETNSESIVLTVGVGHCSIVLVMLTFQTVWASSAAVNVYQRDHLPANNTRDLGLYQASFVEIVTIDFNCRQGLEMYINTRNAAAQL